ncbi:3'-phosphoesterase [Candidatus Pacearchaeota archaeon ex4484_26]|nr:MAG: 3'-phosphoesterase [Candidatus Pacearchaeota archaeon ex4484_26]
MDLKEYWKKRDFTKTKEPKGRIKKTESKKRIFVIQEHQARHLHWDLRLEMQGVLKSWALPKIPPRKAGEKRLAVQVEDHPLDYATFEGTIPKGSYGAGQVKIWDKGTFQVLELKPKKILIDVRGKKLKGKYALINFKNKNWLFFKIKK